MFYSFIKQIAAGLVFLLNGKTNIKNKNRIPDGSYVLVAPHRTWMDPIIFALSAYPKQFSFMAKQELFQNKLVSWFLTKMHAFPVDRQNPGPSAIKIPVKALRKDKLSIMIFPSGTRHSQELKNGAFVIAKLANKPLVPVVYQGPLTFKNIIKRQKMNVNFGDPIYIDRKMKMDDENFTKLENQLNNIFKQLDDEINPNYKYVDPASKK